MTLTTHALVGAAAASLFPTHPYVAFVAGFASHFAIDSLPHWDYIRWLRSVEIDPHNPLNTQMRLGQDFVHDVAIIAVDALLGTVLAYLAAVLSGLSPAIALIGAWAGIYPDVLQFVYQRVRHTRFEIILHDLQLFHKRIQEGKHRNFWPIYKGIGYQALLVAGVFLVVLLSRGII